MASQPFKKSESARKNRALGLTQKSPRLLAPTNKSSSGRPFLKCRSESIWALPPASTPSHWNGTLTTPV
ncbi:hypothetical protein PGT21_022681 [Puccinia graminis f. sp. tritici]|uniref:Uncharacterized protein n=1 Tax=Puccinia graminis f. sp. tritici TaxID=56615 RepID=A0A5B0QJA8_PUCGR|nr:hypothetical protein PGT21_022681 [Puccinia graminis f. sp. tritici]